MSKIFNIEKRGLYKCGKFEEKEDIGGFLHSCCYDIHDCTKCIIQKSRPKIYLNLYLLKGRYYGNN